MCGNALQGEVEDALQGEVDDASCYVREEVASKVKAFTFTCVLQLVSVCFFCTEVNCKNTTLTN